MSTKSVSITDITMGKLLSKLDDGDVEYVKKFFRDKVAEGKAKRIASGDHFAVHRAWGENRGPWNVTHRHSGLSAVSGLSRKAIAILWANEFATLPIPWDSEEPLRGLDSNTMDRCVEMSRLARNGGTP